MSSITPLITERLPRKVQIELKLLPKKLLAKLSTCVDLTRLSDGVSNQNWRLCFNSGEDWVLRINNGQTQWCDRANEVQCWQSAYQAGLAPKLIYVCPSHRLYISEFIQELTPWSFLQKQGEFNRVTPLLDLFTQIVELPPPKVAISIDEQWQTYLSSLDEAQLALSKLEKNTKNNDELEQWQSYYRQLSTRSKDVSQEVNVLCNVLIRNCFCHRDLSPTNLLIKPSSAYQDVIQLCCIDFEYAAFSHPLFELAVIIETHQLNDEEQSSLVEGIFKWQQGITNPYLTHNAKEALSAAINFYHRFCAAWALLMSANQLLTHGAGDAPEQLADYFSWCYDSLAKIS